MPALPVPGRVNVSRLVVWKSGRRSVCVVIDDRKELRIHVPDWRRRHRPQHAVDEPYGAGEA